MMRVGLTGGIAAGKSAVVARLAQWGATIIDSDVLAREVVQPGTPGLAAIEAAFGPQVITESGELDRAALGAIVFADPQARRRLEEITHPRVRARSGELEAAALASDPAAVIVHDIPLLVEKGMADRFDLVVVVHAPEEVRLARMIEHRQQSEGDARARMAAQASDAERAAVADVVLTNDGSVADLHAQVDRLWSEVLVPRSR